MVLGGNDCDALLQLTECIVGLTVLFGDWRVQDLRTRK
jgi:hypothetical protein